MASPTLPAACGDFRGSERRPQPSRCCSRLGVGTHCPTYSRRRISPRHPKTGTAAPVKAARSAAATVNRVVWAPSVHATPIAKVASVMAPVYPSDAQTTSKTKVKQTSTAAAAATLARMANVVSRTLIVRVASVTKVDVRNPPAMTAPKTEPKPTRIAVGTATPARTATRAARMTTARVRSATKKAVRIRLAPTARKTAVKRTSIAAALAEVAHLTSAASKTMTVKARFVSPMRDSIAARKPRARTNARTATKVTSIAAATVTRATKANVATTIRTACTSCAANSMTTKFAWPPLAATVRRTARRRAKTAAVKAPATDVPPVEDAKKTATANPASVRRENAGRLLATMVAAIKTKSWWIVVARVTGVSLQARNARMLMSVSAVAAIPSVKRAARIRHAAKMTNVSPVCATTTCARRAELETVVTPTRIAFLATA